MLELPCIECIVIEKIPGDVSGGCSSYYVVGYDRYVRLDEGGGYETALDLMDSDSVRKDVHALLEEGWYLVECNGHGKEIVGEETYRRYAEAQHELNAPTDAELKP